MEGQSVDRKTGELFGSGPLPSPTALAPFMRTLQEVIDGLSLPIPDIFLGTKTKGGAKLTIFSVWTAQKFADFWAHGWCSENTFTLSSERIVCSTRILIPTSDHGLVWREGSGDDSEDDDEMPDFDTDEEHDKWVKAQNQRGYGSPATRAEAQAFKRALARFGFGVYLRDRGKPLFITDSMIARPNRNQAPQAPTRAQGTATKVEEPRRAFGGPGGTIAPRPMQQSAPAQALVKATTSAPQNAEAEPPVPTPWENFEPHARKHLTKIGCADTLVDNLMSAIHRNLEIQGKLDDVDDLRTIFVDLRAMARSGEAVEWLSELHKVNSKGVAQKELFDE